MTETKICCNSFNPKGELINSNVFSNISRKLIKEGSLGASVFRIVLLLRLGVSSLREKLMKRTVGGDGEEAEVSHPRPSFLQPTEINEGNIPSAPLSECQSSVRKKNVSRRRVTRVGGLVKNVNDKNFKIVLLSVFYAV